MKTIVIILCIIGVFFAGWKFIDDRMKQNKIEHMEHALSLAQHNPKKAVEYLREHIGNQNMPEHIVAQLANPHERVNRLYPQMQTGKTGRTSRSSVQDWRGSATRYPGPGWWTPRRNG